MNNENSNQESQTNAQGADLNDVMKMFSDYDNNSDDKPKQSKESILSKYFTPRNSQEKFRILPPIDGREIVEKAFFHYVPVNNPSKSTGKGYRKIYCSRHNSPRIPKLDSHGNVITTEDGKPVLVAQGCPLCEKSEAILKNLDLSVKYIKKENLTPEQLPIFNKNREILKEASKWEAKKYHIVRGIDRGMPKDGVKFWRFKDNYKKQGVLDKLVPALRLFMEQHKLNPTDIERGADLYINVIDTKMPNGTPYKDVSSITAMNPSKLYEDKFVADQWLGDRSTWRDVFKEASMTRVLDSHQYLERIAKGTDPYWDDRDQNNKRYVFPDPADAELMVKANEKTESLDGRANSEPEMASDVAANIIGSSYNVNIGNVTSSDVGHDIDNSIDVGKQFVVASQTNTQPKQAAPVQAEIPAQNSSQTESQNTSYENNEDDNYDDLPF